MFIIFPHLSLKKINWTESSAELLEDNFSFGIPRGRWEMRNTDNILNRFDLLLAGFCSVARRWRHHGVAIATDTYNSHRSAIDTRSFRKEKRKKMKAAFLAPSCASRCASSSATGIPQCEGAVAYHFAIRIRRDVFSRDTTGHKWRKAKFKQLYFPSKLVCCTRCVC